MMFSEIKTSKQNPYKSHNNWFDSSDGDDNLETFCQKTVVKTPVRPLKASNASPTAQNLSPQFRVGWNDGSQKNICDMSSPVSAVPTRRKIRRCPENLLSKISPSAIDSKETKSSERNSCDLLHCIDWAKSLIESSSLQPSGEEVAVPDKSVSEITQSIKDTSLDIALDDSSNELMILCSQAIEESVMVGTQLYENRKPHSEKHNITPSCDRTSNKRFKPQFDSNNVLPKGNIANFDFRLNSFDKTSNNTSSINNSIKIQRPSAKNISTKNYFNVDNFKKPTEKCVNNNNKKLTNFNKDITNFQVLDGSCEMIKENTPHITSITSFDKSLSTLSNDDIKSHLDDEDDVFCSLDFNFLDSLHKKTTESSNLVSKTTTAVVKPQVKDYGSNLNKYSKQEIEKRRLEAKKRLLFNKKHRSM